MPHLFIEFSGQFPRRVGSTRATLDGLELPVLGDAQLVRFTADERYTLELELETDPFTPGGSGLPAPLEAALVALGWTAPPEPTEPTEAPTAPEPEPLTPTERRVLDLRRQGKTYREIAEALDLTNTFGQPNADYVLDLLQSAHRKLTASEGEHTSWCNCAPGAPAHGYLRNIKLTGTPDNPVPPAFSPGTITVNGVVPPPVPAAKVVEWDLNTALGRQQADLQRRRVFGILSRNAA